MNMQVVRTRARRKGRAAPWVAEDAEIERAAREAVARAWASGSFLIVRDTARRIAGAERDASREELADDAARALIAECARVGVAMVFDARDAAERLRADGTGGVLAL